MDLKKPVTSHVLGMLVAMGCVAGPAMAHDNNRDRATLLVTSTNNATANSIVVFKLGTTGAPSLSYVTSLTTGGAGGAGGNAGLVQFSDDLGVVANYGSNSVTQLVRYGDFINIGRSIGLASGWFLIMPSGSA